LQLSFSGNEFLLAEKELAVFNARQKENKIPLLRKN
jgi:hypothetical protein